LVARGRNLPSSRSIPFIHQTDDAPLIEPDPVLARATVFDRSRPFSREEFRAFIFAQSTENKQSRVILDDLTATGRYLLAALNNEGRELNEYRIREFHLTRNFTAFSARRIGSRLR